jgi:riboflavin biosynthesis pyrimidine reductase
MQDVENVVRLFPTPVADAPLQGLYLQQPFAPPAMRAGSFVYANFIASLDGRISLPEPRNLKRSVPRAIANRRDWRLFQELATSADALLTSGRHVRGLPNGVSARSFPVSSEREYEDLARWRSALGLAPQPAVVIVTASLDLPPLSPLVESGRAVYVATGSAADPRKTAAVESQGARVLDAGDGARVEGRRLVEALAREAHRNIALIAGGEILNALVVDDVLDRLYLTFACRMLGGLSFDTLLTGPVLPQAAPFTLKALHYDPPGAAKSNVEQLFAIFDRGAQRGDV